MVLVSRLGRLLVGVLLWTAPLAAPWGASAADPVLLFSYECLPATAPAPASYAEKAALAEQVRAGPLPELFAAFGLDPAAIETGITPGGYLLATNPSLQSRLAIAPARAERLAAALGYLCRQSTVLVTDFAAAEGGIGYAVIAFAPGSLTAERAQAFFAHAASIDAGLGGGYTAFGDEMIFLNIRGEDGQPYSGLDDAGFIERLDRAAGSFAGSAGSGAVLRGSGTAAARFIVNDWDEAPDGGAYLDLLSAEAGLAARIDRLRERHGGVLPPAGGTEAGR